MANPRYNTQTTNRRGAMGGGRMKKMGGGMTRNMYSKGSKDLGRANMKKGSIPPQLEKFVMAKKKKAKMKKNKKKVIG